MVDTIEPSRVIEQRGVGKAQTSTRMLNMEDITTPTVITDVMTKVVDFDAAWTSSSRAKFLLAAIGAAVGFGNVWRFPAIAHGMCVKESSLVGKEEYLGRKVL